jgi:hypothetical protein
MSESRLLAPLLQLCAEVPINHDALVQWLTGFVDAFQSQMDLPLAHLPGDDRESWFTFAMAHLSEWPVPLQFQALHSIKILARMGTHLGPLIASHALACLFGRVRAAGADGVPAAAVLLNLFNFERSRHVMLGVIMAGGLAADIVAALNIIMVSHTPLSYFSSSHIVCMAWHTLGFVPVSLDFSSSELFFMK